MTFGWETNPSPSIGNIVIPARNFCSSEKFTHIFRKETINFIRNVTDQSCDEAGSATSAASAAALVLAAALALALAAAARLPAPLVGLAALVGLAWPGTGVGTAAGGRERWQKICDSSNHSRCLQAILVQRSCITLGLPRTTM